MAARGSASDTAARLGEIRAVLGEALPSQLLLPHLHSQGEMHWAVNSYFRAHFEAGQSSFNYLHDDAETFATATDTCRSVGCQEWLEGLEVELLLQVLSFLGPRELCRATCVSRRMRDQASDNNLWRHLCAKAWGLHRQYTYLTLTSSREQLHHSLLQRRQGTAISVPDVDEELSSLELSDPGLAERFSNALEKPGSCRRAFELLVEYKRTRRCPSCQETESVVPVVYGFPSKQLMRASKEGLISMGWDYKQECDPNWECRACGQHSMRFPWGPVPSIKIVAEWCHV